MANKSNRARRAIYENLKGVQFFEPDKQLLLEKNPNHAIFKKKYLKPAKHQLEILWDLSNICTHEEIVINRRAWFKSSEKIRVKATITEIAILFEKTMNAETLVQAKALAVTITEKAETMPEAVKADALKILGEVMGMLTDKLDPVKLAAKKATDAKAAAIAGLLKIDIDTAKQAVLANYCKILGVKGKDKKAATLRPLLKEFLEKLKPEVNEETEETSTTTTENDKGVGTDKETNESNGEEKTDKGSGEENKGTDTELDK